MRIDLSAQILGQSMLDVRRFLRRVKGSEWPEESVAEILGLSPSEVQTFIKELLRQGIISESQKTPSRSYSEGRTLFRTTVQGNALAMASAAKPIYRKTTERLLEQFLQRVQYVNNSLEFVYEVTEVRVFGSYLTDASRLGDIDLAITLEIKESSTRSSTELTQWRIHQAVVDGRTFRNIVDELSWPQQEVLLHLRHRSSFLSLHMKDPIIEQCETRVIFSRNSGQAVELLSRE